MKARATAPFCLLAATRTRPLCIPAPSASYFLAMPMQYDFVAIPAADVPRAANPVFQHLLDTYASETSKVVSVWREFRPDDMPFKPQKTSSTVLEIIKHQLLSERRFF